mmetsp:Transcript_9207/g.12424  ORF Transcript_9207/g.12424 Transcript_9207/m.12424 type:complete len:92 (-) Transcript_9207:350-625(-)
MSSEERKIKKRTVGEILQLKWRQFGVVSSIHLPNGMYNWEIVIYATVHFVLVACLFFYIFVVLMFLSDLASSFSLEGNNDQTLESCEENVL